jgi:FkbM family methyltransferase
MILKILESISKYIRSKPMLSRYFLMFSRKIADRSLLYAGFKLSSPTFTENMKELKNITGIEPKTIFDVGSAIGKWSRAAGLVFPDARIYSFEPVPGTFKLLKKNTNDIPRIKVFNCAIANFNGVSDFWLNDFNDSSSLLEMTDVRRKEAPCSKNARLTKVECRRLDSIPELEIVRPFYVKIDAEGTEKNVLEGMGGLADKIDVLHVEYTFKNYFKGQTEMEDILQTAKRLNLDSSVEINTEYSLLDGSKAMCDLIFFRRKPVK